MRRLATLGILFLVAGCSGGGQSGRVPDSPPEPEQTIRVVDGDTLDINGERHRFAGIDAPERHQTCIDANGVEWACGRAATEKLEALIGEGPVSCSTSDTDRYGRSISSCSAGGADLGEALVRAGLALNEPRYTPDRSEAEAEARVEGAGMHAGRFMPPWSWRAGARLTSLAQSFLASDIAFSILGLPFAIASSCDPAACTFTYAGDSQTVLASDILPDELARDEGPFSTRETDDEATDVEIFGYWLEESGFGVLVSTPPGGPSFTMGFSIAEHFSATDPRKLDGGATWWGVMLGRETGTATALRGRVQIALDDFSDPSVDVLFAEIAEIIGTGRRPDMSWQGIPVEQGAFSTGAAGYRISGRFYGDIHQEAGGVFTRDGITGAFGAKREPYQGG